MIYQDLTKTSPAAGENPETTTTLRLGYENGCLTVYSITHVDTVETLVLGITQPWKCNPDGSREAFADATDAFAWAESVKDSLL